MKNVLKNQLRNFNINEDADINEVIEFLDSELKELNPLLKKLENEEKLDKETTYNIFLKYHELLKIHKHIYQSANNMISYEEDADKKDVMYGYG